MLAVGRFAATLAGQIEVADRALKAAKDEYKELTDPLKGELQGALRKVREGDGVGETTWTK